MGLVEEVKVLAHLFDCNFVQSSQYDKRRSRDTSKWDRSLSSRCDRVRELVRREYSHYQTRSDWQRLAHALRDLDQYLQAQESVHDITLESGVGGRFFLLTEQIETERTYQAYKQNKSKPTKPTNGTNTPTYKILRTAPTCSIFRSILCSKLIIRKTSWHLRTKASMYAAI